MFIRVKRSVQSSGTYEYLQIVESVRDGARVRQRVIGNLGRRDQVVADGTLDGLLRSLAKFSERLRVVERVREEGLQAHQARSWGPALVFERLWREQRMPELLRKLADGRRFGFDVERVAFALALQRLCAPGSDLQGSAWLRTVEAPGFDGIALHHLYRTVGFLEEVRDELERALFFRDRDLLSQSVDLIFIDTTSTFVYRFEETGLRQRGYSRDRMPDQPQVVICLAVDAQGWPIAWDILPGSTADKPALVAMIQKLRERFRIRRAVVVADRGMISKDTIALLEDHSEAPFDFILGCRMRQQKEVNEEVLVRAGRYQKVADNLEVKEVLVEDRRYVVCRNPTEATKDAAAREALLAKLAAALAHSPKSVVGNKGFARFLKVNKSAITIDREAIERDQRLDGKFVLRTSTDLPTAEVALAYKSLWRVERAFRETKQTLDVRPLYHHHDDTTVGHIVGCFLALRLEVDLQRRLDAAEVYCSWPDLMRDLDQVKAVEVSLDERRYRLRTELRGHASAAFTAAGVRPPRVVEHIPDPPAVTDEMARA
ncbi:MAG TPA: IS1634 family transposase [Anaeromyxobacteraceae bacterium]|nr:IS1634 family transposase [Anaeromyxobacteraceae bacterium]